MSKSISQLNEITDNQDNDLYHVSRGGVDYKKKHYTIENGVKRYKALVTQSGTDAPTVVVLENTIGDIIWTRDSAGNYLGTLAGAFLENKVFTLSNLYIVDNNIQYLNIYRGADDYIIIQTFYDGSISDNLLSTTPILIEVYP